MEKLKSYIKNKKRLRALKSDYLYEKYFDKLNPFFKKKDYLAKFKFWCCYNNDQNFFKNLEKSHKYSLVANIEKEIKKINSYIMSCVGQDIASLAKYDTSPIRMNELEEFKEIEKYLTKKTNKMVYDIMSKKDFSLKFFVEELEKIINDTRNFTKKLNPKYKIKGN